MLVDISAIGTEGQRKYLDDGASVIVTRSRTNAVGHECTINGKRMIVERECAMTFLDVCNDDTIYKLAGHALDKPYGTSPRRLGILEGYMRRGYSEFLGSEFPGIDNDDVVYVVYFKSYDGHMWKSAGGVDLKEGDILRVRRGERFSYAICTGSGFGCHIDVPGNAIFVRDACKDIDDVIDRRSRVPSVERVSTRWGQTNKVTTRWERWDRGNELEMLEEGVSDNA